MSLPMINISTEISTNLPIRRRHTSQLTTCSIILRLSRLPLSSSQFNYLLSNIRPCNISAMNHVMSLSDTSPFRYYRR